MQRGSTRLITLVFFLLGGCAVGSPKLEGDVVNAATPGTDVSRADDDAGEYSEAAPADSDGAEGANDARPGAAADPADGAEDTPAPDAPGAGPDSGSNSGSDNGSGMWKGMRVGTNFWFLSSWGENAWRSGVSFANTLDPWNPAFIADLEEADYAVFRFMDFGGTNNSSIRNWSERAQKTSQDNLTGGDYGGRGIAYEWMFDLCNRLHKDCWITVPHLAIESYEANAASNYFSELAKLAKDTLDPSLTLYIEYSNETWNGLFQQASYGQERGMSANLDGTAYAAGFKFHVYASSRMNDAFMAVYGGETGRVRWVLAGQLGGEFGTTKQLEALADPRTNFGGRTPAYYAISNYVGGMLDGASSAVSDGFRSSLSEALATARRQAAQIAPTGMTLISYEGGQHITTNADAFSRNPAAYNLYTEWLTQVSSLYALTMHYGHSGAYSAGGAWGAKESTGQPLASAPKARALVDWIKAHPTTLTTADRPVP